MNYKKTIKHILGAFLTLAIVFFLLYSFTLKETRTVSQKIEGFNFIDTELAKTIVTKNCGLNFKISKDVDFFFIQFSQLDLLKCNSSFQSAPQKKIHKDLLDLIQTKISVLRKLKKVSPKKIDIISEKDGAYVRELNRQLGLDWYKVRFESADLLPLSTRASYLELKSEELRELKKLVLEVKLKANERWKLGEISRMSIDNKRMVLGVLIFSLLMYYSVFVSSPPVFWLFKK